MGAGALSQFVVRLQFWEPVELKFQILFPADAVSGRRRANPTRRTLAIRLAEKSEVGDLLLEGRCAASAHLTRTPKLTAEAAGSGEHTRPECGRQRLAAADFVRTKSRHGITDGKVHLGEPPRSALGPSALLGAGLAPCLYTELQLRCSG